MEITLPGIVGVLNLVLIIIVGCFNFFSHNKIVGNDLHHVNADLKMIIEKQEVMSEKIVLLATDLAYVKGSCSANTRKKTLRKSKKI